MPECPKTRLGGPDRSGCPPGVVQGFCEHLPSAEGDAMESLVLIFRNCRGHLGARNPTKNVCHHGVGDGRRVVQLTVNRPANMEHPTFLCSESVGGIPTADVRVNPICHIESQGQIPRYHAVAWEA